MLHIQLLIFWGVFRLCLVAAALHYIFDKCFFWGGGGVVQRCHVTLDLCPFIYGLHLKTLSNRFEQTTQRFRNSLRDLVCSVCRKCQALKKTVVGGLQSFERTLWLDRAVVKWFSIKEALVRVVFWQIFIKHWFLETVIASNRRAYFGRVNHWAVSPARLHKRNALLIHMACITKQDVN